MQSLSFALTTLLCTLSLSALCSRMHEKEIETHIEELLSESLVFEKALVDSLENSFQSHLSTGQIRHEECIEFNKIRTSLLMARVRGAEVRLLSSVLSSFESDACPIESNALCFLLGNVYFLEGQLRRALETYEKSSPTRMEGDALLYHVKCQLNASSALHQDGLHLVAINKLDSLLKFVNETQSDIIHSSGLELTISINLAAMQLSAHANEDALAILKKIDDSTLNEYWTHIKNVNLLIAYQGLDSIQASSELWNSYFQNTENLIERTAPQGHKNIVQECLLNEDFNTFLKLWSEIHAGQPSRLNDAEHIYHNLFSVNEEEIIDTWSRYVAWEKQHQEFQLAKASDLNRRNNRKIKMLNDELDTIATSYSSLKQSFALFLAFIVVVTAFIIIRRLRRKHKNRLYLDTAMKQSNSLSGMNDLSSIELEDLRTIGDALVSGKNVNEAMLVLKKIRSSSQLTKTVGNPDLTSIAGIQELNETECKILKYLVSGFDAKETARMLNVSPSHIYNMRSMIRIKLEIPRDEQILTWLMNEHPAIFEGL